MPTTSSLRRLLPYYHPYRRNVAAGLMLVVTSAAFSSVVPWFLRRALGRQIHSRFEAVQEQFSDLTTLAQENLAGVRIVRAFRQEQAEIERFEKLNEGYLTKNMRLAELYGIMQPGFSIFAGLGMVAVVGLGGRLVLTGSISVGSFVAFGMYLGMLTWPLIALGGVT